ncbi:hypothetical protein HAX54_041882, partial [Datura stramonium]|nr:hypothetical protein [Datura stramonium]
MNVREVGLERIDVKLGLFHNCPPFLEGEIISFYSLNPKVKLGDPSSFLFIRFLRCVNPHGSVPIGVMSRRRNFHARQGGNLQSAGERKKSGKNISAPKFRRRDAGHCNFSHFLPKYTASDLCYTYGLLIVPAFH